MATKKTTTKKLTTAKKAAPRAPRAPRAARASGGVVGSGGDVVDVAAVVATICADGFFQPLVNDHPYMKVGVDGLSSTGKSQTLAELAIGLWHRIRSTKPVVIVDTENARRFLVPLFRAAGVPVVVRAAHSLVDWREAVARAEGGAADIVITDTLTHFWEETARAYCLARGIERLDGPADWVAAKDVWHREWAAPFRDARVHLLFASRAKDAYVDTLDANTGKRESVKVGTAPRGENETAFEPSLYLSLHVDPQLGHVAVVEKDRTDTVHGETLPLRKGGIYSAFAAVVDATLVGAVDPIAAEERSSSTLFEGVSNRGRIKGLVGDIRGLLNQHWPSSSAKDVQTRADALHQAFGHSSWPRIEHSDERTLRTGLQNLQAICAAGGPTITPTPKPDNVVATIRAALANDPGDGNARAKALAVARTLGGALPAPHRGEALGIVEAAAKRWEQGDVDQRDPWAGDDLPC